MNNFRYNIYSLYEEACYEHRKENIMELYIAFIIVMLVILGTGIFGISKIISEIKKLDE